MKHTKFSWVRPSVMESLARLFDFNGALLSRRVRVAREDALTLAWRSVGDCLRGSIAQTEHGETHG